MKPRPLAVFVAALVAALPALAQYKIVGPDGKVTYTDRPPAAAEGRVTALGARAPVAAAEPALPAELRQAVGRYPVALYVSMNACEPCDQARGLLRRRGVPFSERQVLTAEDGDALERLTGGRDAPTLTIGGQTLRGLAPDLWNQYLDAAGYPRDSRLPPNYQYPPAAPIVERREAARPTAAVPRPAAQAASAPLDTGVGAATPPPAPPGPAIQF